MFVVNYGSDIVRVTYDALAASDISSYLDAGYSVAVKPNLVVPCPASGGATTHPEVVEGIIVFLRDFGVRSIKIIESSWVGDSTKHAFKECGFEELSGKFGVPLVDLKGDSCTSLKFGEYKIKVCDEVLKTDFLINVPVLKAHCQTKFTCCMKNLKGCVPDGEKRRFHSLGIDRPVAALNTLVKTGYCVVDGVCGDLSFEEGGTPVYGGRIIAGRNPLTVDSYCAELIGYKPDEIAYLKFGREFGVGEYFTPETEIIELNSGDKPKHDLIKENAADRYKSMIDADSACSVCYSALVYALRRVSVNGRVAPGGKIRIGQGFRGKGGTGAGAGDCANGFEKCAAGCPPKATDIIGMLSE